MFLKSMLEDTELPSVIIHRKIVNKQTNMESPGQALKHYAPYLPCYFLVDEKKVNILRIEIVYKGSRSQKLPSFHLMNKNLSLLRSFASFISRWEALYLKNKGNRSNRSCFVQRRRRRR